MVKPGQDLTEKELETRTVYRGRLLTVKEDKVQLPDGSIAPREYIVHPGAVVMIAVLNDGELLFERQHRYPLRRDFIELPAGKIHPGEDPLITAQRELLEETGYTAKRWKEIAVAHPCIGYSDERLVYYLARELAHEGSSLDDGEFLEVIKLSLETAVEWVRQGRITDAKTIAGLFWAEKILREGW
ncbi:MAG: NUDIX hydrolase [Betaproteobacteria bacterium]|nr:NUDIX hydrolase [Betaproteobacteria bacterium]